MLFRSGRTLTRALEVVTGDPGKPLDDAMLESKARAVLGAVIGEPNALRLAGLARGWMESDDACAKLRDAFCNVMAD